MPDIYGPILPLQLDPRNTSALVRDTQTKIFLESEGSLNDFSSASPLSAIVEGQAYAQNELLYYLNSLPEAYTLQWLRQLGIQRSIGAKAIAEVTFIKTQGFTRSVVIPKGTIVSTGSQLKFILKSQVIISDSQTSGIGLAESERWGTVYNVPIGSIERANINILGLEGVTNFLTAKGGKDLESVDNMKAKAFSLLRRRGLISAEDYFNEVQSLAPGGSIIKVLTYEDRFNLDTDLSGNIVICIGNEDGEPISDSIKANILSSIRKKSPIGVSASIIGPIISPVETSVSIEYDPEKFSGNIDFYASKIDSIISEAISPSAIELGDKFSYQELFNEIYSTGFVEAITSMVIKVLQIEDEENVGNYCNSPFVSEKVNEVCIDTPEAIIDSTTATYNNTNPIRSYRYCKNIVTLISTSTQSPITYTFTNQEYKRYLEE